MTAKSNSLNKALFVLTIFPVIFQDLPTGEIFGTIARTPVVFLAPIIFCILLLQEKKILLNTIPRYYLFYFLVTVITSILMMLYTVIFTTNGRWNTYSEFFPLKLFKASQYSLIFFLFAFNAYTLIQKVSIEFVLKVFQSTLIFLLLYGCLEIFTPYPIIFIHSTFIEEWKTRLVLTGSEPSSSMLFFSCIVFSTMALRMYLNKNILVTIFFAVLSLAMLLGIGSKSGVAFIVVSLLWVLRKNFSFKYLMLTIIISIPIVIYIINYVVPELLTDIDGFSSFSTRTTTMCVAIKSLFIYPLGQGYGTYIVYFPKMLLPMNQFLINLLQLPLLDYELQDMIDTGKYLGVKSGILQEVLYNGITAIVFFYMIFKYYFRITKQIITPGLKMLLSFAGVYCLIELLFTAEYLTAYYYLFPFLLIFKFKKMVL
jgi:hypothetical protein